MLSLPTTNNCRDSLIHLYLLTAFTYSTFILWTVYFILKYEIMKLYRKYITDSILMINKPDKDLREFHYVKTFIPFWVSTYIVICRVLILSDRNRYIKDISNCLFHSRSCNSSLLRQSHKKTTKNYKCRYGNNFTQILIKRYKCSSLHDICLKSCAIFIMFIFFFSLQLSITFHSM